MSLLLLFGGGSSSIASFTLADTISLSATEGSFDTIDLDCEDLASLDADDAVTEVPLLFQGDSCNIRVVEGITATVSTGSIAKALTESVSIAVSETLTEEDSFAVTETASISVTDAISANQISPQALADTINLSTDDLLSADIGVPVTVSAEYDDTIGLQVLDVLTAAIPSDDQVQHITFTPKPDHITFST